MKLYFKSFLHALVINFIHAEVIKIDIDGAKSWSEAQTIASNYIGLPTREELAVSGVRPEAGYNNDQRDDEWFPVRRDDSIVGDFVNIGNWTDTEQEFPDYHSHLDSFGSIPSWGGNGICEPWESCTYMFVIDSSTPSNSPSLPPSNLPSLPPSITLPKLIEWYIENFGNATAEIESSDIIMISLPFNASNREMGADVYIEDCVTNFNNSESLFQVATTKPTSSQADGFIHFNTTLGLNITALNATGYWNDFTDGTRGGWVEVCVETSLEFNDLVGLGNGVADQDVVFKNNLVNVSVSLTSDFTVENIDIEREDATVENIDTDYTEFIKAYECEESDLYNQISAPIPYNQGDIITICVTDESSNIVQVEKFFNLKVSQTGRSDYNFITNSLWNPEITTPLCVDGDSDGTGGLIRRVCYAKIRALGLFFEELNEPNLIISGSMFVIRDGRRVRRNLHMALPDAKNEEGDRDMTTRRAQEDGRGSSDFEVNVFLNAVDDSATPGLTGGATALGLVSILVGAAGTALMV